jgi:3-hydroxyisobutyrate dehydrogenase
MGMKTIALLGTGIMGSAMARRLRAHGLAVRAWNRTPARAEPLREAGVELAETPRVAASGADALVTMLSDGPAVLQAVDGPDGALAGVSDRCIWLQTSTVGVSALNQLIERAARAGLPFVDAPVLGTREPAERGELTVLAAGPRALEAACAPVWQAIARKVVWLDERPGAGSRAKLVLNAWVTGLVSLLGETIALAEGLEVGPERLVGPERFLELLRGGALDVPYAQVKGRAMIERALTPPSFPLRLAHKDVRLILEAAREAGLSLPVMAAVEQDFDLAEREGHGDEDMAAVVTPVRPHR